MIANDFGARLRAHPRRSRTTTRAPPTCPAPGFAAGPCLLKDTMQLAAFNNNNFTLGHASMMVNEGLPALPGRPHRAAATTSPTMTVGILGMAFKAESDDTRVSLSYKLKRLLGFKAAGVLCTDPYVTATTTSCRSTRSLERPTSLVVGAPHHGYRDLQRRRSRSSTSGTCSASGSRV